MKWRRKCGKASEAFFTQSSGLRKCLRYLKFACWAQSHESRKAPVKCHPRTVQEGPEREWRYSSTLFNLVGSWGWVVNATPRPLYPHERDPVPIVQDGGWAPGPVWTGAENLAPTGIRSVDRPARSESLYRLRYSSPRKVHVSSGMSVCVCPSA